MLSTLIVTKMNDKPKTRLPPGRKKLPPEEKIARQKLSWQKKYSDKVVFQARIDKENKDKLEAMKKHLGFKNNDQLLVWLRERGERSIARKEGGFELN